MGRIFTVELEGRSYGCKSCKTHLALADDLISRAFYCQRGKAYLFNNVVNFTIGVLEERMMLSGLHTVADIFCCCCGQIVGWKYLQFSIRSLHMREAKSIKRGSLFLKEEGLLMKLISPLNSILRAASA
ncbi:protein yippee-like At5g53940 isoform X4 [Vigna umbellata]|uniref:Protein yippee-like n=1 Tax=Vigna radiata var. radiata TaxID=3916 RepID=A0A3Q0ERH1_VIGRR|nr:protein yippee-like At5g53940 isoform X4 [Vigna radiata var. radiata]XP_047163877.1 protein yippee-like At5g53940 isoform X4 [Vigna umbellata]